MKTKIMYDVTMLLYAGSKDAGRTGIYWVVYNVAHILNKNKNVKLMFYISPDQNKNFKNIIKNYLPEFKNVKIWPHRNFFDDVINFYGALKQFAKNENHKVMAECFHIIALFSKFLFFAPRKIVRLINKNINADVFLSPMFKVPDILEKNTKIKRYTILYDIIPFLFPKYYKLDENSVHNTWLGILIKFMKTNNTDKYFAISESTAKDFMKMAPSLKPDQMIVTPLACSDAFHPCSREQTIAALKKYKLPTDKKYVFSLCSLEPRKNLIRAVKTFVQFIKKNKIDDMVFIMGGAHWEQFIGSLEQEINDLGDYKDKIIKAGYIDDEDLAPLYSGAEWFVYTSQYEGFGLPPLEAMQCGTPVITSNNSSLPEVVGDAGVMIDWDNDEQHIESYEKYYFDRKYRDKMATAGLKRAKEFSWEKTVDIMLQEILKK